MPIHINNYHTTSWHYLQEHIAMHSKIKNHFRNTTKPGIKATYAVLYKNQTFKHSRHYANKKMRE